MTEPEAALLNYLASKESTLYGKIGFLTAIVQGKGIPSDFDFSLRTAQLTLDLLTQAESAYTGILTCMRERNVSSVRVPYFDRNQEGTMNIVMDHLRNEANLIVTVVGAGAFNVEQPLTLIEQARRFEELLAAPKPDP